MIGSTNHRDRGHDGGGHGGDGDELASPWRGAKPELVIAALLAAAVAVAGYVTAGWAGLSAVITVAAAIALAVPRALLPKLAPDRVRTARKKPAVRALTGYGQLPLLVHGAIRSLASYNGELRPVLERLLAARLAQRHGVDLHRDPAAARALLCRDHRDADLWPWIDPATRPEKSPPSHADLLGIPRHLLARLIDRLEDL